MPLTMTPTVDEVQHRIRECLVLGSELQEDRVLPSWISGTKPPQYIADELAVDDGAYITLDPVSSFGDDTPSSSSRQDPNQPGWLIQSATATMQEWYTVEVFRSNAFNIAEQLRMWFRTPFGIEKLRARGLGVYRIGATRNTTEKVLEKVEKRSAFELTVTFIRVLSDRVEQIQSMESPLIALDQPSSAIVEGWYITDNFQIAYYSGSLVVPVTQFARWETGAYEYDDEPGPVSIIWRMPRSVEPNTNRIVSELYRLQVIQSGGLRNLYRTADFSFIASDEAYRYWRYEGVLDLDLGDQLIAQKQRFQVITSQ